MSVDINEECKLEIRWFRILRLESLTKIDFFFLKKNSFLKFIFPCFILSCFVSCVLFFPFFFW